MDEMASPTAVSESVTPIAEAREFLLYIVKARIFRLKSQPNLFLPHTLPSTAGEVTVKNQVYRMPRS
ncbi:MAG: hypothetical protein AB4352_16965 [Hormoscilla sp.]